MKGSTIAYTIMLLVSLWMVYTGFTGEDYSKGAQGLMLFFGIPGALFSFFCLADID